MCVIRLVSETNPGVGETVNLLFSRFVLLRSGENEKPWFRQSLDVESKSAIASSKFQSRQSKLEVDAKCWSEDEGGIAFSGLVLVCFARISLRR